MTMVTSYDWQSDTFTHHAPQGTSADAWRQAVQAEAARMHANAPDLHERIADVTTLVLTNQVALGLDGYASVASRSTAGLRYDVNGTCPCPDAQHNTPYCSHKIAVTLLKRATKHLTAPVTVPDAPPVRRCPTCFVPLDDAALACSCAQQAPAQRALPQAAAAGGPSCPEAAFSLCLKGRIAGQDAQLTVRGQTPEAFLANVQAVRGMFDAPATPAPAGQRPVAVADR